MPGDSGKNEADQGSEDRTERWKSGLYGSIGAEPVKETGGDRQQAGEILNEGPEISWE